jgi:Ser/Thr protein kinase RdoA (MazF antagonist)
MDQAAREVCQAYAVTQGGFQLHPLGNAGGFSGARLWRVETFGGNYCLKAWPANPQLGLSISLNHSLVQRAALGLHFVPQLMTAVDGRTWVEARGRVWELATWMPGKADFHEHPTRARLRSAMSALAQVHGAWAFDSASWRTCPGVEKRLSRLLAWQHVESARIEGAVAAQRHQALASWCRRASIQFHWWARRARLALEGVNAHRPVQVQLCLCDIWHDHVLFTDQEVTGLVDYGGIGYDSVATDLARLLGSFLGDDAAVRNIALDAYNEHRRLTIAERDLVPILDWTGVVVGVGNWLRWLYLEGRQFEDQGRVVQRLSELVTRMEGWKEDAHGPVGIVEV